MPDRNQSLVREQVDFAAVEVHLPVQLAFRHVGEYVGAVSPHGSLSVPFDDTHRHQRTLLFLTDSAYLKDLLICLRLLSQKAVPLVQETNVAVISLACAIQGEHAKVFPDVQLYRLILLCILAYV